jgi:5'-3' exonuclease
MPYLTEAADIQSVISVFSSRRILWIDTETAEWWTPQPRLSLIQVLDNLEDWSGKQTYVLDVLARPELVEIFINKIMLNPNIEKVFHNASYDLRFLGGKQATKVTCTMIMANKIKNRLSVPNVQLKTLAVALCNFSNVDQDEGKSNWGRRPLTNKQLQYAQMDPVYLAQVYRHLLELTNPSRLKTILRESSSPDNETIRTVKSVTELDSNKSDNSLTSANPPLFILVDGHSLAFLSYFAFAKGRDGGLKTKTGIPTSVCFAFIKSLLEVIAKEKPQAMAIAFDLGLPTFRHEADDTYKADRPGTPEDFVPDLKNLQELLEAFNVPVVTSPGFEADDVLATLAHHVSDGGYKVKIVTGDRDLFQLVDPEKNISVLYLANDFLKRGNTSGPTEFGTEEVKQKLGILPAQVVDYKALCGDKSDNIPGVRGLGDNTAVKLLNEYGSMAQIYASLDKIKGAVKTKLEAGKKDAEHSRNLAQLRFDAPVNMKLEDGNFTGFDSEVLKPLLEKLELKAFLGKIDQIQQMFIAAANENSLAKDSRHQPQSLENQPNQRECTSESTEDEQIWVEILDRIERRTVQTLLRQHGYLLDFNSNVVRIGIKSEALLKIAQRELSYVEAALQKVCGRQVQVILQVGTLPESKITPAAQQIRTKANNTARFFRAN